MGQRRSGVGEAMPSNEPKTSEDAQLPERFSHARAAQAMAVMEDYVEMISDLMAELGEARIADIAQRMGVTHPTATKAIARLKRSTVSLATVFLLNISDTSPLDTTMWHDLNLPCRLFCRSL